MLIAGDSADLTNAIQANDRIAVSSTRNGNCGKFCQHIFLSFNLSLLLILNHFSATMPSYMTNSARFNPAEIVGGQDAPSPIQWQVSVQSGNFHFCGATILDESTLLCAAHCFPEGSSTCGKTIRAGSTQKSSGGQVYSYNICISYYIFVLKTWFTTFFRLEILLKSFGTTMQGFNIILQLWIMTLSF